jgi:hypothetical protein
VGIEFDCCQGEAFVVAIWAACGGCVTVSTCALDGQSELNGPQRATTAKERWTVGRRSERVSSRGGRTDGTSERATAGATQQNNRKSWKSVSLSSQIRGANGMGTSVNMRAVVCGYFGMCARRLQNE